MAGRRASRRTVKCRPADHTLASPYKIITAELHIMVDVIPAPGIRLCGDVLIQTSCYRLTLSQPSSACGIR